MVTSVLQAVSGKFCRTVSLAAATLAVCVTCLLLLLGDARSIPALILNTDYLEFYSVGHMARSGALDQVYLPLSATVMGNATQIAFAARLPGLDPQACAKALIVYSYPPAVAFVFAPLTFFPFKMSLIAWQLISLICLFFSCIIFTRLENPASQRRPLRLFLLSFFLLNVAETLVIGQMTLALCLLPWVAAYYFWRKQRPIAAGLAVAVLALKPQLFMPAAAIMAVMLVTAWRNQRVDHNVFDRRGTLIMVSVSFLAVATLYLSPLLLGGDLTWRWWHQAGLLNDFFYSVMYAAREYPCTYWDRASLWATIALDVPGTSRAGLRVPFMIMSAAMFVGQLIVMFRIASCEHLNRRLKLDCLTVTSFAFLPLTAAYLSNYDLCVLLLPAWIICAQRHSEVGKPLFQVLVLILLALDAYWLALPFLVTHGLAKLAMTALQAIFVGACLFICTCISKARGKPGLQLAQHR